MPKNTKDLDTKKVKNVVKEDVKLEKETPIKNANKKTTKKQTKKSSTSSAKKKTSKTRSTSKSRVAVAKKSGVKKRAKKPEIIEYYDLPYRYNQTIVKLLAQTPNTLFVYWDISEDDKNKYVEQFGKDFFQNTFPVLIIHNITMNYTFEIEINDFANCWYFNVDDANCEYKIELGRRTRNSEVKLDNNYLHISSSNNIQSPNNHILFEKNQKVLFFRNVKDNKTFTKDTAQFNFMSYVGRVYTIYDVYKKMYTEEQLIDIKNPSSNFSKGAF